MKKNISSIIAIVLAVGLFSFVVQGTLQVGKGFRKSKRKETKKKVSKSPLLKALAGMQAQPTKTISKVERAPLKKVARPVIQDVQAKQMLLSKIQQQRIKQEASSTIGKIDQSALLKRALVPERDAKGANKPAKDYVSRVSFLRSEFIKKGLSEAKSNMLSLSVAALLNHLPTGAMATIKSIPMATTAIQSIAPGAGLVMKTIPGLNFITIAPRLVSIISNLILVKGGWRARAGYLTMGMHKFIIAQALRESGIPMFALAANTIAGKAVNKAYRFLGLQRFVPKGKKALVDLAYRFLGLQKAAVKKDSGKYNALEVKGLNVQGAAPVQPIIP